MRTLLLALLLTILPSGSLLAQPHVDSLEARRAQTTGADRLAVLAELVDALSWRDPQRALTYGREALSLLPAHPDPESERRVRYGMGLAYEAVGVYDSVLVQGAALHAGATAAGDAQGLADGAYLQGLGHRRLGAPDEAAEWLETALAGYEALGDRRGIASALTVTGHLHRLRGDYDEALAAYERALALGEELGDQRGTVGALLGIGLIYRLRGSFDEALAFYHRALALCEEVGDRRGIAGSLNNIGLVHLDQGNYDEALTALSRALSLREELGDRRGLASALNNIGIIYSEQGDLDEALTFYRRALALLEALGDRENVARLRNNIGLIHQQQGAYDEALVAFGSALALREELGDRRGIASSLESIGLAHEQQGDYEEALHFYGRTLALREALGDQRGTAGALQRIGRTRLAQGQLEAALTASTRALALADSVGEGFLLRDVHKQRSQIFERQERFAEALQAYKLYKAAHDSLFNTESQGVVAELQEQYRTREQAQRIELLEQRRQVQRLWVGALGGGLILLLLSAGLLYSRFRLKNRAHAALLRAHEQIRQKSRQNEQQAAQLRQLDQLKSRFFANVSHEFRTPLTLTLGPLEDVASGLHGPVPDAIREQVALARRNAERVLSLVNEILDVAKLEAGRMRLQARPLDLAAFLRARAQAFVPLAERKQIAFTVELPPAPLTVYFDPEQLDKVFTNLLSNAFKFTPAEGTVNVQVQTEGADGRDDTGGLALVRVRDSGAGIPTPELPHVFERFHQVDEAATRLQPGTGIGLTLARELAELHGGTITVESREGFGSTFTVALPLGRDHLTDEQLAGGAAPPPAVHPPDAAHRRVDDLLLQPGPLEVDEPGGDGQADVTTVLVVEDNAEVRAYVRRHLQARYRVIEAADGAAGLERARRLLPDLVLSDVMMPEMDGLALCHALKTDPETDFIPVILLTARATVEDRLAGLGVQADDYLTKPFDVRELVARVNNTIAARKLLRARFSPEIPVLHARTVDAVSSDAAFLEQVRAVVEAHLGDEDFSVASMAEALGLGRTQLYRRLQASLGQTPSEVLWRLRLERAGQLLAAQAGTVSEVAYTVGFKSVAHFSRRFRQHFGASPSAYRGEQARAEESL